MGRHKMTDEEKEAARIAREAARATEAEKPAPVTPDDVPDQVLDTLGIRYGTRIVTRDVQATHPDGSPAYTDRGPLMTRKEVKEEYRDIQPTLTLEEAKKLGKQNWKPWPDGGYTCGIKGRRFVVTDEVYAEICQA